MWRKVKELDLPNGVPVEFQKEHRRLPFLKQIFKRAPLISLNIQGTVIKQPDGLIEAVGKDLIPLLLPHIINSIH